MSSFDEIIWRWIDWVFYFLKSIFQILNISWVNLMIYLVKNVGNIYFLKTFFEFIKLFNFFIQWLFHRAFIFLHLIIHTALPLRYLIRKIQIAFEHRLMNIFYWRIFLFVLEIHIGNYSQIIECIRIGVQTFIQCPGLSTEIFG